MIRAVVLLLVLASPAAADDWQDERCGLVVEASAGVGALHHGPWSIVLSVFAQSDRIARFEALALGGAVGVGLWIQPRTALTFRAMVLGFRSAQLDQPSIERSALDAFVGPNLQYWLSPLQGPSSGRPHLWLAGGMGLAVLAGTNGYRAYGFGLDARAGYAIGGLQLSLEGTEGIFDAQFNTITALFTVGYQY